MVTFKEDPRNGLHDEPTTRAFITLEGEEIEYARITFDHYGQKGSQWRLTMTSKKSHTVASKDRAKEMCRVYFQSNMYIPNPEPSDD